MQPAEALLIDSVGPASAEFARNADLARRQLAVVERHGQAQIIRFCANVAARVKPGS